MPDLTTQDITNYLGSPTASRVHLPFSYTDIASAIRTSAERGDIGQLARFLHSNLSYLRMINPTTETGSLIVGNYVNAANLAVLADNPDINGVNQQDVAEAFSDENLYGPTMRAINYLASRDGVDLYPALEGDAFRAVINRIIN